MKLQSCVIVLLLTAALIAVTGGCRTSGTVKIGFIATLSGKYSDSGISCKNGVLLALEKANAAGGIHGRPLELMVRDDHNNPPQAIAADRELIEEGAAVLIGHMTSLAAVAALPFINSSEAQGVLMISPTARSSLLSGIDDQFMSMAAPLREDARRQAEYARQLGLERLAIIYDLGNREFTEDWISTFAEQFKRLGGQVSDTQIFVSGAGMAYGDIIRKGMVSQPDAMLIAANDTDTVLFCQQIYKNHLPVKIFATSWSMTGSFLENGGRAVEGVIFANSYNLEQDSSRYEAFCQAYTQRFGRKPDFVAAYGYETAEMIIAALHINSDSRRLKQTIVEQKYFDGLWGQYTFDQAGDIIRPGVILSVSNGKFKLVQYE